MLDIRNKCEINRSHLLFDKGAFCGTLELKVQADKLYSVTRSGETIHQGKDIEKANSVFDAECDKADRQFN